MPASISPVDPVPLPPRAGTPFACLWMESGRGGASAHISGELDVGTAPQLRITLSEAFTHAPDVVLDLRELTFMDGAGTCAIVRACLSARQIGSRLLLVRGPPQVDRLFRLTNTSADVEVRDLARGVPATDLFAHSGW